MQILTPSRVLVGIVVACVLVIGGVLVDLKLHEDELIFETALSRMRAPAHLPADAERLNIRARDGSPLAALILRPERMRDSKFWVLHLHGNADSAFSTVELNHCARLRDLGLSVLSFDYRGFGPSPGIASETHMDEDAEAAYEELIHRGVLPQHIILWGHSLGSGPAVLLATQHPAAALVLFGAFTSIPDLAQDTYPYLPVRWITGVHFDSIRRIGYVHAPVLIAHSKGDTLIPFHHARRLFAAAKEPKRLLALDGAHADGLGGHLDALYDHPELVPVLTDLVGPRLHLGRAAEGYR